MDQGGFDSETVYGIQYIIKVLMDQLRQIVGGYKILNDVALAVRINGLNAAGHHLTLGLTYRFAGGMELTIDVGDADIIQIDQSQGSDTGSSQRLGCPGTHSTNTYDADMGLFQPVYSSTAIEPTASSKAGIIAGG